MSAVVTNNTISNKDFIDDDKGAFEYVEGDSEGVDLTPVASEYWVNLPESLQGLSVDELEQLEKRTKWKIDIRILPMLVYIYILNYLDRNNIATARLGGLEKELGLKGSEYQTAISILFVGYILMQIPSNMILNKLGRPALYMTVVMTLWGVISACCGAVQNYAGLVVVRFLLGWIEAGFFGSALYYLSMWYTRKELALRNSILYSGSLISSAVSGLIGLGILEGMEGVHGISAWRWLFIIEGAITVGSVPFAYVILPDKPSNTKFLSQQEKDMVMWKLTQEVGQADDDEKQSKGYYKDALLLALKDMKVWLVTGILSTLVAAAGVTNFFPSVVSTLGFNRKTTLGLTAPPYGIAVVATFIWARHADKTGERYFHVVIPLLLSMVSFIIAVATLSTAGRYFAMCMMVPSMYCAFTVILTWMSNCVPRPPLKRAISLSLMNCLANSTSIWNAYLYPSNDAPRYLKAFCCNIGFLAVSIILATILRIRISRLNKRIAQGTMNWWRELGNDGSHISPDFRYLK
ncbi:uncharacterized protein KQ657_001895 [Scheffersomyces spartinae]|uniref:Major facilitator superfamily (MFS) profile domain-containing protein n=1 Tax=Scheffersomyces spartinae TaxID=45513 RepID=A0A9P7V6N3_9ASCO|nr:uncharacterized protein KQ657_001895 [Scheffersomyces spartinae]KAG7192181.1 hypothetical protein KQ657_001895 [Scheffersomyces spartinae]